jgi:hypothetical protein
MSLRAYCEETNPESWVCSSHILDLCQHKVSNQCTLSSSSAGSWSIASG